MLKGKACINCRRRKIKCDGDRPSCGQCARSNGSFEDCEYPGAGPTRTQILEERITHVQTRIRELENTADRPSLVLHHPYFGESSPRHTSNPIRARASPGSSSPPSSTSGSPASVHKGSNLLDAVQEPPRDIILLLLDVFYQHCKRIGFFLDIDRFHQSVILPLPTGHHARPSPALLNAVYLWGSHLSSPTLDAYDEKGFLRNALHHLSSDLSGSHPQRVLHGIQAEVLLSYYYLRYGKVLGGNYHAIAAVSLSLSSGLHRIGKPGPVGPSWASTSSSGSSAASLSTPVDGICEGEGIDAFWTVIILNNYWVAIQESHSMFYNIQNVGVDTPWPMDASDCELLKLLPRNGTIKRFLEGTELEGWSVMALHAKVAVLLEQATVLQAKNPPQFDSAAYVTGKQPTLQPEYIHLDMLIDQFRSNLSLLAQINPQPADRDTLLIVEMIAHVANIKLHALLSSQGNTYSRQKCLFSAQSIASLTQTISSTSAMAADPIVGVLWSTACEVFISELQNPDSATTGNNAQWSTLLSSLLAQMNQFSTNNLFMKFLVYRLQKNHAATPSW